MKDPYRLTFQLSLDNKTQQNGSDMVLHKAPATNPSRIHWWSVMWCRIRDLMWTLTPIFPAPFFICSRKSKTVFFTSFLLKVLRQFLHNQKTWNHVIDWFQFGSEATESWEILGYPPPRNAFHLPKTYKALWRVGSNHETPLAFEGGPGPWKSHRRWAPISSPQLGCHVRRLS